jgi:hypothetical protein
MDLLYLNFFKILGKQNLSLITTHFLNEENPVVPLRGKQFSEILLKKKSLNLKLSSRLNQKKKLS